jgi:ribosomal 50S subunit-recycling heat shock protein
MPAGGDRLPGLPGFVTLRASLRFVKRDTAIMRLDKWLKLSRIIKRRTVAQGYCDAGRVSVNGRTAKPATALKAGDRLTIRFSRKEVEAEVLVVPTGNISAQAAATLYRIIAEHAREPLALLEAEREAGGDGSEGENGDADLH